MKKIIVILIFYLWCGFIHAQKKTPGSPDYKISLTTNKIDYSLGEPIMVTVKYYNRSNTIWQLYRPDSSFYNSLSYRNVLWRTESRWNGYAFNKSRFINDDPDCPECGFAVALTGGIIQLEPTEKYSFKTDMMIGQMDHAWVLPGNYIIRYQDSYEAIQSDTIKICMKFTENSTGYILQWLIDEKESKSNIQWAIMLLSDIYPDIKNYQYQYKDSSISYADEQTENNRKLLEDFKLYWEQNKYTDVMQEKIHKINTDLRKYSFMDMRRTKTVGKSCIDYNQPTSQTTTCH